MGVDAADYEGNGRASLFVTNYRARSTACIGTAAAGVSSIVAGGRVGRAGPEFVGFGAAFLTTTTTAGRILIVNGHVLRHPPSPSRWPSGRCFCETRPRRVGPPRRSLRGLSEKAGPSFHGKRRGRDWRSATWTRRQARRGHSLLRRTGGVLRNGDENGNHWLGVELRGGRIETPWGAADAGGGRPPVGAGGERGRKLFVRRSPGGVRPGRLLGRTADRALACWEGLAIWAGAGLERRPADRGSLLEARAGRRQASALQPRRPPTIINSNLTAPEDRNATLNCPTRDMKRLLMNLASTLHGPAGWSSSPRSAWRLPSAAISCGTGARRTTCGGRRWRR